LHDVPRPRPWPTLPISPDNAWPDALRRHLETPPSDPWRPRSPASYYCSEGQPSAFQRDNTVNHVARACASDHLRSTDASAVFRKVGCCLRCLRHASFGMPHDCHRIETGVPGQA
jgi:hypothetical protein